MLSSIFDRLQDKSLSPPVRERAKFHPNRTVVHNIPGQIVVDEECNLKAALAKAGYGRAHWIELHHLHDVAVRALVGDLHQIAMDNGIHDYEFDYVPVEGPSIQVIFLFTKERDAVVFKLALQ
jgi:hypothetical protein